MAQNPYFPTTDGGIGSMLVAFDTNASNGTIATKYSLAVTELNRVRQARYVWQWFADTLEVGRMWVQSVNGKRDLLFSGEPTGTLPLPTAPTLPTGAIYPALPASTPTPAVLEPGFFEFFTSLVAKIKSNQLYDKADGTLLGIEGSVVAPPDPAIIPLLTGDLYHSGHPSLTCKKGVFQGYTVWLTRPNMPRRIIGFSLSRNFEVTEPLPAPGTAEIWTFEVQYKYKDQPFGQMSQPLELTVRG